jgi:hypothetical protein
VSPVARSQAHAGRALAVAAVGVVLVMGVAIGVAVLANRGSVEVHLGDQTFTGQRASKLAPEIADHGPVLYSDAASGDRDIVLQHLGTSDDEGWIAMAARPAGVPRNCTIQWQDKTENFRLLDQNGRPRGPCDGRTYPADGKGLPTYPVTVHDGKLSIDINAADRPTTTAPPPTTTGSTTTVPRSGSPSG